MDHYHHVLLMVNIYVPPNVQTANEIYSNVYLFVYLNVVLVQIMFTYVLICICNYIRTTNLNPHNTQNSFVKFSCKKNILSCNVKYVMLYNETLEQCQKQLPIQFYDLV